MERIRPCFSSIRYLLPRIIVAKMDEPPAKKNAGVTGWERGGERGVRVVRGA